MGDDVFEGDRDFAGRSVFVTGAGSGIGRTAALLFAAQGARVAAFDMHDTVESLADESSMILPLRGDAGDEASLTRALAAADAHNGLVDIGIANAGISGGMKGLFDLTAADWRSVLNVNVVGAFLLTKMVAQALTTAGRPGAIVCTASVAGMRAGAGGAAYSASKAGVINLVATAAQQLAGTGIRVNAVCPGLVETGMTQSLFDRARENGTDKQVGQLNPLRRCGNREEIAGAIAFLASNEASYINGHALVVDGGLSSSLPFARAPEIGKSSF